MNLKKIVIILFIIGFQLKSQTFEIQKLSESEVIGVRQILDADNKDVYGYFILKDFGFSSEYKWKYEYILLDKNYNQVLNGFFIQDFFHKKNLKNIKTVLLDAEVYKDKLLISYGYFIDNESYAPFDCKFRFIDLKTNKVGEAKINISDQLSLEDKLSGKEEIKSYQKKDKVTYLGDDYVYRTFVVQNNGFLVYPAFKRPSYYYDYDIDMNSFKLLTRLKQKPNNANLTMNYQGCQTG